VKGLLLDLDGTLYVDDAPLPGAVHTVRMLVEQDVPCRYLTNTTRISRRELALRLQRIGFPISAEQIFTAPRAAAAWLAAEGIRQVALHLPAATREDFVEVVATTGTPEAIVVGDLGEEWSYSRMNAAFRQLMEGARLVALQKNRFWKTAEGLALDAGPFVAALEYATGREAVVVGKPSREFFRLAAASMGLGPEHLTVIGDDVETDVGGAQAAGMRGVLVRTGKYRPDVLAGSGVRPDGVVDTLAEAVALALEP
jgi:phospholysine phosphohistidine inorganic pyrophosphate phosphatase